MSIRLMSQVWEYDFDHPEQSILMAMADHANDDGEHCFPSVSYIAWKTGYSERHVKRILKSLREVGVLEIIREATHNRPPEYRICLNRAKRKPPHRGDNMSSLNMQGGDNMSPQGGQYDTPGVTSATVRGDTHVIPGVTRVSPEPSYNHHIQPSEGEDHARASPSVQETDPPPQQTQAQQQPVAAANGDYLPGLPYPKQRRQKTMLDRLAGEVRALNMGMEEFRLLTDHLLTRYGQTAIADTPTAHGDQVLAYAQDTALTLAHMGFRAPPDVDRVFSSWEEHDYRGKTLPTSKQLIDHAGKMVAGVIEEQHNKQHGNGKPKVVKTPAVLLNRNLGRS